MSVPSSRPAVGSSPSRRPTSCSLARCFTVWLRASPDDHMKRVIAQGDLRPMAGNAEAMEDLKRILAAREAEYARSDLAFDTSAATAGAGLRLALRDAIDARLPIAA